MYLRLIQTLNFRGFFNPPLGGLTQPPHIKNCTGDQSDKLWRSKVFQILNEEFEKLPKKNNGARTMSQKWQMDMLHTVIVVLATVNEWNDFIYNRLYDPADFQPLVKLRQHHTARQLRPTQCCYHCPVACNADPQARPVQLN